MNAPGTMKKKKTPLTTPPPKPAGGRPKVAAHTVRRLLHRRALAAAAVGVVPVPVPCLTGPWMLPCSARLLPRINAEFWPHAGTTRPAEPRQREQVQKGRHGGSV